MISYCRSRFSLLFLLFGSIAQARSRWILENSDVDDITAIVVHFPEP